MEPLLRGEYLSRVPSANFAFSRPGLITFRVPQSVLQSSELQPAGLLHRTYGRGIGNVQVPKQAVLSVPSNADSELAGKPHRFGVKQFLELAQSAEGLNNIVAALTPGLISLLSAQPQRSWDGLHFWVRDGLCPAAQWGREQTNEAVPRLHDMEQQFRDAVVAQGWVPPLTAGVSVPDLGRRILDICLVEPHQVLVGEHLVQHTYQRWPGGVLPLVPTAHPPISRAYFKVREAACWAELPINSDDLCVEIGSAPGGSCQWLLEQGCRVIGVDPAEIDPWVMQHPHFSHIRRRGREVKRRDLRGCRWLLSDANLPPNYILDTMQDLLTHPDVRPAGLILTLKLPSTGLLDQWQVYRQRVQAWGFPHVRGRQLVYNRQEVCLVATRTPSNTSVRGIPRASSGSPSRASFPARPS